MGSDEERQQYLQGFIIVEAVFGDLIAIPEDAQSALAIDGLVNNP